MNGDKPLLPVFARLTAATAFPVFLILARSLYVGQISATFLLWNLFLAWLPLLFAALAVVLARRSLLLALAPGLAWLLFLPNAPYLITDLMHLSWDGRVPVLFDTVLLFSCALCGLALGLMSLRWMQSLVASRGGRWRGWLFAATALGAAGFGVYLGRYVRWNSWDLLTQPNPLVRDIIARVANPVDHWHTWAMSLLFASLLFFAYWLFHNLEPR